MLFTTLKTKENEYKLRLSAKNCVELEKKLGGNPVNLLMNMSDNELPKMEDLLTILHYSLQAYNHGISMDDTYGIYDAYVDTNKGMTDLINEILDVYRVSGLIKDEKDNDEVKN